MLTDDIFHISYETLYHISYETEPENSINPVGYPHKFQHVEVFYFGVSTPKQHMSGNLKVKCPAKIKANLVPLFIHGTGIFTYMKTCINKSTIHVGK